MAAERDRQEKEYFVRVSPCERFHRPEKFRCRYRLTKEAVEELAAGFGNSPFATQGTRRGGGLTHTERVCLAIRFLASGSLYSLVCDSQGVDPSTVCRAIDAFVRYMYTVKGRYIKWPKPRQYAKAAVAFHKIKQFPRVLAAVDGTHVALRCPTRSDNIYYSRKKFHSINVLGACSADLQFVYVNAKMPGSTHDAYVWDQSLLGMKAKESGFKPFVLLGDSGYALRTHMLTPLNNPQTEAEKAYNKAHKSTRCTVERAFGVLKQRFRVLDQSAGYIMSSPEKVSLIIIACVCLHNIAIRNDQEMDIIESEVERIIRMEHEHGPEIFRGDGSNRERNEYLLGLQLRNTFIETYFNDN